LHATIQVALRRHDAERLLRESNTEDRRRFEQQSSALLALTERLSMEANTDALTELYNRRYMDRVLIEQLQLAERESHALALILLDLDRFKHLNDSHGHAAGDKMLAAISGFLRRRLRTHDAACRYGGEELAIIAPGACLTDAINLAERLRAGIEKIVLEVDQRKLSITASFGVSAFPEHGFEPDLLLRAADMALYRAKSEGRNRVIAAAL
jgi:diguanylate cyclase (GGDEF)-like protein